MARPVTTDFAAEVRVCGGAAGCAHAAAGRPRRRVFGAEVSLGSFGRRGAPPARRPGRIVAGEHFPHQPPHELPHRDVPSDAAAENVAGVDRARFAGYRGAGFGAGAGGVESKQAGEHFVADSGAVHGGVQLARYSEYALPAASTAESVPTIGKCAPAVGHMPLRGVSSPTRAAGVSAVVP